MKICFFGNYKINYSRNRIILAGLRRQGVEIIECQSNAPGIKKYIELFRLHWKIRSSYDVLFVPFPGYAIAFFARFLTLRPIVYDALISIYDSLVYDRAAIHPRSIKALWYWLLDYLSMHFSNAILFDTFAHITYASKTFFVHKKKCVRLFIGASDDLYYPSEQPKTKQVPLRILFYGWYIPLQGTEVIIEAARLLRDEPFVFRMIGKGQERRHVETNATRWGLTNVEFVDSVAPEQLRLEIGWADICLGIFGRSEKTLRVIPNKVYEAAACGATIITADTPAIREVFCSDDLVLIPRANPSALAEAIRQLAIRPDTRMALSQNVHRTFSRVGTIDILGAELVTILERILIPSPPNIHIS